ncbi:class II glutamine amidotransferase [Cellulomonas soli]|uniref:Class II glutamine amidotransferase n=1 Tax=Cellulomonas soli TaxID=931535 RepID=A0A512PAS2_9CELL|nr:class II glutamine amidotransferase [Cellulomonas soli]NYI57412.1 glutamine amidotransferase [Cellulomonas soli]GEP68307.1 class II glutamine amidotransferase [Cellulomonas soli]
MCRWLAYTGSPVLVEDLLYKPANSLVMQSLHSHLGAEPTNGDGFGVGWYDDHSPVPGLFRSTEPAWNDQNLRELSAHARARVVLAHIRASSGSAVQQTNCHPFRHGPWLWMHNGVLSDFHAYKRDLVLAVDPELFPLIAGSTDSEVLFYLALTFGLEQDPPAAVARAVGFVEAAAARKHVPFPVQMTVCTTDGQRLWAFRYSSEGRSRSLFHSTDVAVLREQYPDNPTLHELSDSARLVVSEPLGDLRGAWREVPESTCVRIEQGREELTPFAPVAAATA